MGGNFTIIDVGANGTTKALGINDSGQIVGSFRDATGDHGFVDTGGSFTTIDLQGAAAYDTTSAHGINNSGQIVGSFQGATAGFLAPPSSLPLATCLIALSAMAYRRKRAK